MKINLSALFVLIAICTSPAAAQNQSDPNNNIVWQDCRLLTIEGKGWADTESPFDRLPAKAKGTVRPVVWDLSHNSAGLLVRFSTNAKSIQVRWTLLKEQLALPHMPATGVSGIDIYAKTQNNQWRFVGNGKPSALSNQASFKLPPAAEYTLYFPLYNGTTSLEIGIPKDKNISKSIDSNTPRQQVVFYGTSITQGGCASRPGMASTAIIGRTLDVSIINLGFSGNAQMEPEIADLLAELNPSVYVLDCLANMTPEMVSERVEPFVKRLRLAHPKTPILLAEDANVYNITPTAKGIVLRSVYKKLKHQGIANLYFLESRNMLGTDSEGTVDGTHPNDLGMMRQAAAFSKSLSQILKPKPLFFF